MDRDLRQHPEFSSRPFYSVNEDDVGCLSLRRDYHLHLLGLKSCFPQRAEYVSQSVRSVHQVEAAAVSEHGCRRFYLW